MISTQLTPPLTPEIPKTLDKMKEEHNIMADKHDSPPNLQHFLSTLANDEQALEMQREDSSESILDPAGTFSGDREEKDIKNKHGKTNKGLKVSLSPAVTFPH